MRTLTGLAFMFLLAGTVPALADHPGSATSSDLRTLRTEVNRLDDSLLTVDDGHPRTREFRQREGEIRDELVRLRDRIRRHQRDPQRGLGASKAEVDALQRDVVDLRGDIESSIRSTERDRGGDEVNLPDGTEISIRLDQSLSSRTARAEDRVVATVADSVLRNGRVVIPAGTEVRGSVLEVERASRPAHGARVELNFDSMVLDGRTVGIQSRLVSLDEGRVDKRKAGLGAILGGVVGAVIDGKKGAVIGALVGGTGAVVGTRGNEVELPAGTLMIVRLDRPLNVVRR